MRYDRDLIYRSELPYKILRAVSEAGETSATDIADEHGFNRSTVSEILSQLESAELIKKGKRTQKQFYELGDLMHTFRGLWTPAMGNPEHVIGNSMPEGKGLGAFGQFLRNYCEKYMERNEESTIEDMMVNDFFDGIHKLRVKDKSTEWLDKFYGFVEEYHIDSPGSLPISVAMEETELDSI